MCKVESVKKETTKKKAEETSSGSSGSSGSSNARKRIKITKEDRVTSVAGRPPRPSPHGSGRLMSAAAAGAPDPLESMLM